MAAFDFPNNPSNNQTYTANGIKFIWNGSVWKKDATSGVKGEKGQKGEQGDKGQKGQKGIIGDVNKGQKGEIGPDGGDGGIGDKGNTGNKGEKGQKGAQGDIVAGTFNVTLNGAQNRYLIDSVEQPTLRLVRGFRYNFNVNVSGHPFWIKTSQTTGTSNGASGVTNNGAQTGTVVFDVPLSAPATLYYICQYHGYMYGIINTIENGQKGDKGQKGEDNSTKGQKGDDNSTKGQKGQAGADNSTKGQKGEEGDKGQKGEDNSTKGQKGQQGDDNSTKGQKGDDNSTKGEKGQKGQEGADNSTKGQKGQQGDDNSTKGEKGQKGQEGADNSTKGQKGQQGDQGNPGADNSTKGQKGESGVMTVNARTSGYSAVASDNGKLITMTTGDLTIGSGVFSAGDAISVANISNAQFNILQGSGTTLYLSGTTQTGNRVLAAKGLCSIICVSSNTFFVSGGGIT